MRCFDLSGSLTAAAVDIAAFDAATKSHGDQDDRKDCFDFSGTKFAEPLALQSVIGYAKASLIQKREISFRIPESQQARDFWRTWKFPEALFDATGLTLRQSTPTEDHKYFGEVKKFYKEKMIEESPYFPAALVNLGEHFPFYTAELEDQFNPDIAYGIKDRWNALHVIDILKRKLGRNASYFPSRVVFEAILNAVRHPGASTIQTAALDQESSSGRSKTYLTVHFWDDGRSIAETLFNAIRGGVQVREVADPEFFRNYIVDYEDELNESTQKNASKLYNSNFELSPNVAQYEALLATILPAVTSDPSGPTHLVDDELHRFDKRLARRGMGLFVLVNTIVEIMNGEVAFRSSNYFMNVRLPTAREQNEYPQANLKIKIRRLHPNAPPFCGNLVVVRVPTQQS